MKASLLLVSSKRTIVILCMVVLVLIMNLFSFIKSKPSTISSSSPSSAYYYWNNYNSNESLVQFEDEEEKRLIIFNISNNSIINDAARKKKNITTTTTTTAIASSSSPSSSNQIKQQQQQQQQESNAVTTAATTTTAEATTTRTASRNNTPNQTTATTTSSTIINTSSAYLQATTTSSTYETTTTIITTITNQTTHNDGLLLSVPFYVYEDMLFNDPILSDYTNFFMTNDELKKISIKYGLGFINETTTGTINKQLSYEDYVLVNSYYKHGGDAMFINNAWKHPMRTNDPNEAKLFVIPALGIMSNLIKIRYGTTKLGRKSGYIHLKKIDDFLLNSTYFLKSQGEDHIVSIQYMSDGKIAKGSQTLSKCNIIQFNQSLKDKTNIQKDFVNKRLSFKAMYVGRPCNLTRHKTHDFALIATMNNRKGKAADRNFESRRNICKWILNGQRGSNNNNNKTQTNNKYSMPVCGEGIQCPTLSKAKLGFHVRGDTNSANRLYDTILSGTVPIFTLKQQYYCQPDWYDWTQLSYFVNMKIKNQTFFLNKLDTILNNGTDISIKTQNIISNKDLFDWNTLHPFDLYMYHLQVKLFPTTKVNNNTKFSALILP